MPPPFKANHVWLRGIANLRDDLDAQGVSLAALSRESGIGRNVLGKLMRGDRAGTVDTQGAIADALGRDPGLYFPRSGLELVRAEALRTQDDRDRTVAMLRTQAQALVEAANTIEQLGAA